MHCVQLRGTVRGLEVVGEGNPRAGGLGLAQGAEFLAAFGDQLVFVLGGGCCGSVGGVLGVRHGGGTHQREKRQNSDFKFLRSSPCRCCAQ